MGANAANPDNTHDDTDSMSGDNDPGSGIMAGYMIGTGKAYHQAFSIAGRDANRAGL